jgi:amino acid adenylation domain-containing protein
MDHLLHRLLVRSAELHPDRTAVEDGERSITYAQLEEGSNRTAHLLHDLGVSRGDRVGLYLEKSLESVVGIYGILKCGAAYVPLDPRAPAPRSAYMAADCGLRVLISGHEKTRSWGELIEHGAPLEAIVASNTSDLGPDASVTGVKLLTARDVESQSGTAPEVGMSEDDLAYVLYTSGSTGRPKGVMLSHLNALAFVRWAVERFEVRPDDRLSSHAPLHFDLSIFDLYAAAMAGAAVVLVPSELSVFPVQIRDLIERKGITIWYSVPSILSMLTLRGGLEAGSLPGLRTILFAGEVFPTKYLRQLMAQLPHVGFFNLYGPTETNVCTYFPVEWLPEPANEPIPIGRAIDGVEVFAVTDEGRRAGPGEDGELYVHGPTVMRGYWGDAERTSRALVRDPTRRFRDPVYRTGDLVREMANGEHKLLGRRDHQIKRRGYRIELGDIETAILAHPDVLECAVIAVPDPLVTNRIRAHVVARNDLSQKDLQQFCADRIPQYMVPEHIELVPALPRTSTGKVDRQALQTVPEAVLAGGKGRSVR